MKVFIKKFLAFPTIVSLMLIFCVIAAVFGKMVTAMFVSLMGLWVSFFWMLWIMVKSNVVAAEDYLSPELEVCISFLLFSIIMISQFLMLK